MSFDHHSSTESLSGGSTFSGKTGPRRSPEVYSAQALLGHVTAQTHYIEPVPPMYVTEYEANYTWPPQDAYDNIPQSGRFEHSLEKHSSVLSTKNKKRRKILWDQLSESAERLHGEVEEVSNLMSDSASTDDVRKLLSSLKEATKNHSLNEAIETVYDRLVESKDRSNKFKLSRGISHHDHTKTTAKEIDRFVDIVRELKGMQKDTKLVFGEKY